MKKISVGKQIRSMTLEGADFSGEEKSSLRFSFSSEYPVERWFGREILSHDPGAANLSRLNDGGQLLFNHDMNDYIGVIENASIGADRKGYCEVRFATHDRAQQIKNDVEAGILRNVSFGYQIDDMRLSKKAKEDNGVDEYTATKWTPYEVSLVTVPADPTIGIGRSEDQTSAKVFEFETENAGEVPALKGERMEKEQTSAVDVKVVQSEAMKLERERISTIQALGEKFKMGELARQLVDSGASIETARGAILEKMGAVQKPVVEGAADLALSEKEKRNYSLVKAIRASIAGNWKEAGFEKECSDEIAKRQNKETGGFFMPMNITLDQTRATYNVGTAAQGGNLVATDLLAGSFIDILRNKALVVQLGAKMLSGLVGNVDIPRQSAATSTFWVTEGTAITQAEATFDKVSLSPKQIGALSKMTRLMLQQGTPDIEALVRNDLATVIALGIDAAAIGGAGTGGVPRGILNQSGIGSVALGTNGGAITMDSIIDLETSVATANADVAPLAYLTNAKQVGALKKLKDTTNNYIWVGSEDVGMAPGTPGMLNGYPVGRSNQVPSNLTKGSGTNLSAVIFGNFSDLIIGEWGALEILPNQYGSLYTSGGVDIRALQTVDIAVRQAASFAAIVDAL